MTGRSAASSQSQKAIEPKTSVIGYGTSVDRGNRYRLSMEAPPTVSAVIER